VRAPPAEMCSTACDAFSVEMAGGGSGFHSPCVAGTQCTADLVRARPELVYQSQSLGAGSGHRQKDVANDGAIRSIGVALYVTAMTSSSLAHNRVGDFSDDVDCARVSIVVERRCHRQSA